MSYKPKILQVSEGGTGTDTLTGILKGNGTSAFSASVITQNAVLYGGASNSVSSTSLGASGEILKATTASAPSFTSAPTVTSISFGGTAFSRYVEGTFTPSLNGSTSNPTISYVTQVGRYTRIGNRNIVNVSISLSSYSGGSGNIRVGTLPFTSNATGTSHGNVYFDNVTFSGSFVAVRVSSNDTNLSFQRTISAGASAALTVAAFTNNTALNLTAMYEI